MTARKEDITQAILHEWLNFYPATGLFTWKKIAPKNRARVGDPAGSISVQHKHRRLVLWLLGRRIYGSRAAYIYVHGDIPQTALVDHIDGDTLNDRISNLRLASSTQNVWNRIQRKGTLYAMGVTKSERGRFKARIQLPTGVKLNLGTWDSEAEAHAAYMGAAAILHSDFWLGNRPSKEAA